MRSLQAFEAVARHLNVSRAAEELGVTQPAVTQQLRRLEQILGLALCRRAPGGVSLTAEGRAYAARLRHAFSELRAATEDLATQSERTTVVTVALLATFAQRWLIPRLVGFQATAPGIEVRLLTASEMAELERPDVDLSIRVGDGAWPDTQSDYLMANEAFPVASPELLARRPITATADLANHVWIQVDAEPRRTDWTRWLAAAGRPDLAPQSWLTFTNSAHALEAAVAGLGIAIGHTPFVVDALTAGRLVAPLEKRLSDLGACYLVAASGRADAPPVARFRDWLLAEARALGDSSV